MNPPRSPEETAEQLVTTGEGTFTQHLRNVAHDFKMVFETPSHATWSARLTAAADVLADPALGEAIEQVNHDLLPWLESMAGDDVFDDDIEALRLIMKTLTALRSPAHD